MKIFQVAKCPFAHRVRIMLEEKGVAYEVGYFQPRARPPELTRLSPDARSPTLFDSAHDTWVWDSLIASEYIEERYPQVAMMPADAGGRAHARLLIREAEVECLPPVEPIVEELVHRRPALPDEVKVGAALAELHAALVPWNARLESRPFLLGDAFTLADIVLYTPLAALAGLLRERAESPALTHLNAWRARVAARPSTAY